MIPRRSCRAAFPRRKKAAVHQRPDLELLLLVRASFCTEAEDAGCGCGAASLGRVGAGEICSEWETENSGLCNLARQNWHREMLCCQLKSRLFLALGNVTRNLADFAAQKKTIKKTENCLLFLLSSSFFQSISSV